MRKYSLLASLIVVMLACSLPGAPVAAPLPTFDQNSLGTTIALTAAVAQTQTALKLPTPSFTPRPTYTPSITPTSTPTFLFFLSTSTPIPTYTVPPTIGTFQTLQANVPLDDDVAPTKNKDEDPRKMSGKEWSCVWYGVTPPRQTTFKVKTKFTVQWNLFNSGSHSWPHNSVDFIYSGGYRNEDTRIQDMARDVGPGTEIKVSATFIASNKPGEFQTFFYLKVGNKKFCPVAYYFYVIE